jgi:hypothetical protein
LYRPGLSSCLSITSSIKTSKSRTVVI